MVEFLHENTKALTLKLTPDQISAIGYVKPLDLGFPGDMIGQDLASMVAGRRRSSLERAPSTGSLLVSSSSCLITKQEARIGALTGTDVSLLLPSSQSYQSQMKT
jgi:hypothetical protein